MPVSSVQYADRVCCFPSAGNGIMWQIDYVGPVPKSQETTYALMPVDMLLDYCSQGPVQLQNKNILSKLSNFYVPLTVAVSSGK